ncbi:MAG: hypothetical protein AAGU75_01085 [Bacillota bacterium]
MGFEWQEEHDDERYFCTPLNAQMLGWLGVDGIHFCFIPSISSEMVFVVSPMPCSDYYVQPIARRFNDFLSLLLFCRDATLLESVSYTDEIHFLEQVQIEKNIDYPKLERTLKQIQTAYGIEENTETYDYVRRLQAEFDYGEIPFSEKYYEIIV